MESNNYFSTFYIFYNLKYINIAKKFWTKELKINPNQIKGKITIIKSGSIGTYRQKSKYGVLILQYHNRKLRDIICNMIENLK